MTFVVADREHARRKELTTILISAFPGSTVYQHASLAYASCDVLHHRVDALLAAGERNGGLELMQQLRKQRPELPVLLLSDMEKIGYGHLPQSVVGQKLRNFLLAARAEGG